MARAKRDTRPYCRQPRDLAPLAVNRTTSWRLLSVVVLALISGCGAARQPPNTTQETPVADMPTALFTDVTRALGLPGDAPPWPDGTFRLTEMTGGGVALLDYDNDGRLDILEVRCPPPGQACRESALRLYRQQPDGTFRDVTVQAGLDAPGYGQGVAIGDVNNDGYPDIYLTTLGEDVFYLNRGDGTSSTRRQRPAFRERSGVSRLPFSTTTATAILTCASCITSSSTHRSDAGCKTPWRIIAARRCFRRRWSRSITMTARATSRT